MSLSKELFNNASEVEEMENLAPIATDLLLSQPVCRYPRSTLRLSESGSDDDEMDDDLETARAIRELGWELSDEEEEDVNADRKTAAPPPQRPSKPTAPVKTMPPTAEKPVRETVIAAEDLPTPPPHRPVERNVPAKTMPPMAEKPVRDTVSVPSPPTSSPEPPVKKRSRAPKRAKANGKSKKEEVALLSPPAEKTKRSNVEKKDEREEAKPKKRAPWKPRAPKPSAPPAPAPHVYDPRHFAVAVSKVAPRRQEVTLKRSAADAIAAMGEKRRRFGS